MTMSVLRFAGAMLLSCLAAASAPAQDFPSRPLRLAVGFGPGGLGDITARAVAQKISLTLGKPVIIENMPGPGGMAAASSIARAEPDGHSLLLVSGQNAINPSYFKSMPYDWANDLTAVSTLTTFDFVIVTGKDSPLKSVADLIAAAKANPGKFNIGTISVGSAQNLVALLFSSMAELKVPVVSFRTTGDIIVALNSGEIQAAFETWPGVIGQVKSGALRAIATSAEKRSSLLPDVPTVVESGMPGYSLVSWNGIVAPAKTPRAVIARLNGAIAEALTAQDLQQSFRAMGVEPSPGPPQALQKIFDDDAARWRRVIEEANIPKQ